MNFVKLSPTFFAKYSDCEEILHKGSDRPYACFRVKIDGMDFAIPIRHHIKHSYAFHTIGEAGLDYSKAVIINEDADILEHNAIIDSDEWSIIKSNKDKIRYQFKGYLNQVKRAFAHPDNPRSQRLLEYSALKYFKEEIIENND
ncbi:MAG: hypothetical protein MJZ12_01590 [Prevotella sp.]|nr:hypothetical protein [Prevotella sp.]